MSEDRFPMTPAGLAKLRAELKQLREVERMQNVRDIEEALAHGDLRENAEYHAAKEKQAEIDARMRFLDYKIARAQVIDPTTLKETKVTFGATVTLLDVDNDTEVVYCLVGEDESDVGAGKISITAPLARAMLGKQVEDEVLLRLPKGDREYEVIKIEYKAID
ncbi:MAG: transcription elongation factor GreA [Myxococcales bacterium]|nr:transcription elongation factor GreA [Myxococcales bacterium]